MPKDSIDTMFNNLEGSFDLVASPAHHEERFLAKLNAAQKPVQKSRNWWKPLSIAASIALLITAGMLFQKPSVEDTLDLASVSPEMEQTQSFFTTTINQELQTLKELENEDTKVLIDDTIERLVVLESEYDRLKVDLQQSGNDKRVIAAMIANFQSRIDMLQLVNQKIEEINTLKANRNETIL